MKRALSLIAACLLTAGALFAQSSIPPAKPGATYGAAIDGKQAISVAELQQKLSADTAFSGKVTGDVVEVCKKKGCFMKLKKSDGETVMVRFKDYGFFMPQNIVGKTVVVDGVARVKETSVERLRHWAEDAGKSKEEIAAITAPKKDIDIVASGVLVVK